MTESKTFKTEVRMCEACGRDFKAVADKHVHPSRRQFCPDCLSPYLLDEDN